MRFLRRKMLMAFMPTALTISAMAGAQNDKTTPEPVELNTDKDKLSYAVGMQVANSVKQLSSDIDIEVFVRAVRDVLEGKTPAMDQSAVAQAMTNLQRQEDAAAQAAADENLKAGEEFLAENAKKEEVKVLDSGLQYEVIEEGTGPTPGPRDEVLAHYRGTLIDGTEFDSSYSRGQPTKFPVHRVIAGWTEALQLMKEGAKWRLYIPPDLAYGARQASEEIPPNSTLIFDIELVEVLGQEPTIQ